MVNYEKVNQIIEQRITNRSLSIIVKHIDEITKLANLILEKTPNNIIKKYSNIYISINDSVKYANFFFLSINPEYSYRFQNILQERSTYNFEEKPSVTFNKVSNEHYILEKAGQKSALDSKINYFGSLNINYYDNTIDTFILVHEITHKFSFTKNKRSKIKMFLTELSPITMEFLLDDFLKKNTDFDIQEIAIYKNNRFRLARTAANNFIYESIIIKLYMQNNNHISEEIIDNYIIHMDKNSKLYENFKKNIEKYIIEIANNEFMSIFMSQKYIIGILFTTYIYEQIQSDKAKTNEFFTLINLLGNASYETEQDLEKIKNLSILPFYGQKKLTINDEVLQKLSNSYEQELNKVCEIYNSNKYSR